MPVNVTTALVDLGAEGYIAIGVVVFWVLKKLSLSGRKGIFTYYPPSDSGQQFSAHVYEIPGKITYFRYLLLYIQSYSQTVLIINPTFKDLKYVDWIITDDELPARFKRKSIKNKNFNGFKDLY